MEIHISGWFGFWLFMAFFCIADTYLFARGYDTFFHKHKTPEEKLIQLQRIQFLASENEINRLIIEAKKNQLNK